MGKWSGAYERYAPDSLGVNVGPVGVGVSKAK